MGLGWAGAGAGAVKGLEDILAEQMVRAQLAQRQKEQADQVALQTRQIAGVESDRAANRENQRQVVELNERKRRDDNNERSLGLMKADKQTMDTDAAIDALPPHMKAIGGLFKVGAMGKLSPDDLRDPVAVSAEAQAKKDGEFNEWKRRQDYSEGQMRSRPTKGTAQGEKAPAKLPVSMATSVSAAKTSLAGLDRLESLYSDDKVGPIAGRYNKAERGAPAALAGLMPDAPKDFEEFAAESATLKNQVIQAITGAAVGVKEQERIMAQIPDVNNTPANWKARAKATRRNLQELMANQTQLGTGAAEASPGAAVDAPAQPQPKSKFTIVRKE